MTVNLGDGDDVFTAAGVNQDPFTINGDAGDDGDILGSDANDIINGGADSDNIDLAVGLNGGPATTRHRRRGEWRRQQATEIVGGDRHRSRRA